MTDECAHDPEGMPLDQGASREPSSSVEVCHAIGGAETSPYVAEWRPGDGGPGASYAGEQLRLPADAGTQQLAFAHLADGLGLFAHQGVWQRPGTIRGWIDLPEPYIEIRLPLAGVTQVSSASGKILLETPRQAALNIEHPGDPCEHHTPTGVLNSRLATLITASHLRELFGAEPLGERLDFIQRPERWPTLNTPVPMTSTLRRISTEMLHHQIASPLTRLFLTAKTVELVAHVLTSFLRAEGGDLRSAPTPSPRGLRLARRARDMLMADLHHPPCVHDLAHAVGLSQRQLNQAFRALYGGSVLECLARWRMELARTLLHDDGLSLKEIAFLLGYDHCQNFLSAFRKQLGVTPSEYRAQVMGTRIAVSPRPV